MRALLDGFLEQLKENELCAGSVASVASVAGKGPVVTENEVPKTNKDGLAKGAVSVLNGTNRFTEATK